MGNTPSDISIQEPEDIWWTNGDQHQEAKTSENEHVNNEENNHLDPTSEFDRKRKERRIILDEKRTEIQNLRKELILLKEENYTLKINSSNCPNTQKKLEDEQIVYLQNRNHTLEKEIEAIKERELNSTILLEKNKELRISVSEMQSEMQRLNSCVLDFEQEKADYKRHVSALKDVIRYSKELLSIRDNELKELKVKMEAIEASFNEREAMLMSNDLRAEYERQLNNIRTLRDLYEERSRTYRRETSLLRSSIAEKNKEIEESTQQMSELQERLHQLEKENSDKYDTIKTLESNLGLTRAESRQYQAELSVINQLFSHILLAFNNSPDLDLDKLLKQLEENHGLLKDIVTNEMSNEVSSALPKVLLDLVNQMSLESQEAVSNTQCSDEDKAIPPSDKNGYNAECLYNLNSPAEIAENLPKVWKVLIELLSHRSASISEQEISEEEDANRCFKTIVTPTGPNLVLSVSKTFVRLKELIIEKKVLEKDMSNLKQLNGHLESRLQDQEKRFEVVSSELSKTWNYVGKLQSEHQLLHTQEQILRYELAQKRKLLKELKAELEYSREKWQQAREKNSKTEKEWLILRKEFAARKKTVCTDDTVNSVESGYSDEREESSSDEELGYIANISGCDTKIDNSSEEHFATNEITQGEDALEVISEDISMIQESPSSKLNSDQNDIELENSQSPQAEISCSILTVIRDEIEDISNNLQDDSSSSNDQNSSNSQVLPNEDERSKLHNVTLESYNASDVPSSSSSTSRSAEALKERLAARDERLKRLEGQCKALVCQVTNTSNRSIEICSKLEDLHEIYGEGSRNTQVNDSVNVDQVSEGADETNETNEDDSS